MQEEKYNELELRASDSGELDAIRKLEAQSRVHREIERMKEAGEALVLTAEEEDMLHAFRRFRLRMTKNGQVFTWQSTMPVGVQVVSETANIILHPSEAV